MRKIPDYAAHVPFHQLVSIRCVTCQARRWAQLVVPPRAVPLVPGSRWPGFAAKCLQCATFHTEDATWVAP